MIRHRGAAAPLSSRATDPAKPCHDPAASTRPAPHPVRDAAVRRIRRKADAGPGFPAPVAYTGPTLSDGCPVAKPNYAFEKRQRELAKKKKQDEKDARKRAEREAAKAADAPG